MNRQYIQDNQVVERYLQGRLTDQERALFEEAYLADPDLLDELERARALREATRSLAAAGDLLPHGPGRRWAELWRSPQYAAAASFALILSLLASSLLFVENRQLQNAGSLYSAYNVVPLLTTRSSEQSNRVPMPEGDVLSLIQVDAAYFDEDGNFVQFDDYRATIRRLDGDGATVVSELTGLTMSGYEQVAVPLPRGSIEPGEHEVLLEGRMRDWPAARGYVEVARVPFTVEPMR